MYNISNGKNIEHTNSNEYKMGKVLKLNSSTPNIQPTEIHETRENNESTWQTRMHRVAIEIASTFVGQAMMMQFDKLLWTLEKTATWIQCGKTDGKRAKAPSNLVRPLPWVFFLPTLVTLRYTRVILSLISICFGYDEIEASTMVAYLHQSRRTIRHIVHEAKRNKVNKAKQNQITLIQHTKWIVGSFLSNLSNLIAQTPDTIKVHNNKTSLNACVTSETEKHETDDQASSSSVDSDSEDQAYQDFLSRTLGSSDSDDEDFVCELNGDDTSDTDSQSSVATEDLSDVDTEVMLNSEKGTNGNAADNDSNYSEDTSTAAERTQQTEQTEQTITEQIEKGNIDDAVSSTANAGDDALNRLIDDTTAATEAKNTVKNRVRHINRHHKNGRFHAKAQNNGKHFNCASAPASASASASASAQGKSKIPKNHHIKSTSDFVADAAAADRT